MRSSKSSASVWPTIWPRTVLHDSERRPISTVKLRFPAPLRVGDRVRMRVTLDAVDEIPGGASLAVMLTFEPESAGKPVCVAQALYRVYEQQD